MLDCLVFVSVFVCSVESLVGSLLLKLVDALIMALVSSFGCCWELLCFSYVDCVCFL